MQSIENPELVYTESWLQADDVLRRRFLKDELPLDWWPAFLQEQKKPLSMVQLAFLEWHFQSSILHPQFAESEYFHLNPTLTSLELACDFKTWQLDKGFWYFFEFEKQKQKFKPSSSQQEFIHQLEEGVAISKSNPEFRRDADLQTLQQVGILI